MAGEAIAEAAARNFRSLRKRGITTRNTIALLIGTRCMENRRPCCITTAIFGQGRSILD